MNNFFKQVSQLSLFIFKMHCFVIQYPLSPLVILCYPLLPLLPLVTPKGLAYVPILYDISSICIYDIPYSI